MPYFNSILCILSLLLTAGFAYSLSPAAIFFGIVAVISFLAENA